MTAAPTATPDVRPAAQLRAEQAVFNFSLTDCLSAAALGHVTPERGMHREVAAGRRIRERAARLLGEVRGEGAGGRIDGAGRKVLRALHAATLTRFGASIFFNQQGNF